MEFCELCDNMLYMKVNKENKMFNYCRSCGNEVYLEDQKTKKIMEKKIGDSKSKYQMYLNKNIVHDNTLPRINNLTCPSDTCTKDEGMSNEVIFVKYDIDNMNYLYICKYCSHVWEKN
jgi:DNA-directed RNA polymerase subunit M/transcription elongation factor TFIIS